MAPMALVHALLDREHTLSVATVDEHGFAWACNLYFARLPPPGLSLVVLTDPDSAHARHWEHCARVGLTVFAHPDTPRSVVSGVQMRGVVTGGDPVAAERFLARFPGSEEVASRQRFYRIKVGWIRLLDRSSGTLVEIDPASPEA